MPFAGLSRKRLLGICVLLLVVFIWVASSNVIQQILRNDHYGKAFLLTYFNTTMFSVYLLGFLFLDSWRSLPWKTDKSDPLLNQREVQVQQNEHQTVDLDDDTHQQEEDVNDAMPGRPVAMLPISEVIKLSLVFCPVWFGANYFFNLSLALTSVSSNTILSTTSSFFTLLFGACVGIDNFTLLKTVSVALCIGGVAIVSLADEQSSDSEDENSPSHSTAGDMLALFSACLYAVYSIMLKKRIGDGDNVHTAMFFGFLGVINALTLWPFLIVLDVSRLEVFELPPNSTVYLSLLLNALIGTVLSDWLWLWGVLLTTPLIATLSLSLTSVLAMISDAVLRDTKFNALYLVGTNMVLISFLIVNTEQQLFRLIRPYIPQSVLDLEKFMDCSRGRALNNVD